MVVSVSVFCLLVMPEKIGFEMPATGSIFQIEKSSYLSRKVIAFKTFLEKMASRCKLGFVLRYPKGPRMNMEAFLNNCGIFIEGHSNGFESEIC